MSDREALSTALADENNLRPTSAALDVLGAVVLAIEKVDESWPHLGSPSAVDYAAAVREAMEKNYLGCRR